MASVVFRLGEFFRLRRSIAGRGSKKAEEEYVAIGRRRSWALGAAFVEGCLSSRNARKCSVSLRKTSSAVTVTVRRRRP